MTTDDISGMAPLVARLSRGGQRLRHADRTHPWVLDTAVVVLVFLMFCLPDLIHGGVDDGDGPRRFRLAFTQLPVAGMLALQIGLVLPLLWRRRKLVVAFGVIAAVFVLQWSLGAALRADVALFVALYSLALHGGCDSCRGPVRPWRAPWCSSRSACRRRCPSGTRCSSC